MGKVIPMNLPRQLECSACGASATASCSCNASYVPVGTMAKRAIAQNPNKSDRAISAESGIPRKTIGRARHSGGPNGPVTTRTGVDGIVRVLPKPKAKPEHTKQINTFQRKLAKVLDGIIKPMESWVKATHNLDKDGIESLSQALYAVSDRLVKLAQELDGR